MLRIAVARIPAPAVAAGDDVAPGWLGESERQRWAALSPAARREFAASRALLRDLLRAATGDSQAAWDVSAQAGAAPVVRAVRGDSAAATVHASLSHRLGWVAAAVSDAPVGIDIECERPSRTDARERAALMLAPAELAPWASLAAPQREAALLARWTVKEAWFKARPPAIAPWDFRRVAAHACASADANVRTWAAPPLHVAVCTDDATALAALECDGLPDTAAGTFFWHVHPVAHAA